MIAFIIVTGILSLFMAIIWNGSNWLNILIKMVWIGHAVFALIMLLQQLFPNAIVQGTAIRLW